MALNVRRPLKAVAAVVLPVLLLALLMHGFSRAASLEIRQRGLTRVDHNAIKHAYAAAEIYSWLRPFLGPERAASAVIELGKMNERAERYLKRTTDWSPEVYKDLRNNLSGIEASEWLYAQTGFASPFTRLNLIGRLAQEGDLALQHTDPRIPPLPQVPDTDTAITKMNEDEPALRKEIAADIAARTDELRAELGL